MKEYKGGFGNELWCKVCHYWGDGNSFACVGYGELNLLAVLMF